MDQPSSLGGRRALEKEIWALFKLGTPMSLTQLVQFAVTTIDIIMIGRLGPEPLAASALANVLFFIMFIAAFGPVMAIAPLVSQSLGANAQNYADVRASLRMGFWLIVLLFPLMLVFFWASPALARAMGQPENLTVLAGPYILALAPSLPFIMGVLMLRNFLASIDRTIMPLVAVILSTGINAFLNYLLIFGHWGFPRLELVGAGVASVCAHACGFLFLLAYIYWDREARKFRVLHEMFVPHWVRLQEIIRLGWPMGISFALEAMLFNCGVFIMGRIGTNEVAAYQVTLNIAAIAFMLPFGYSMAGSVRVGLAEGAGARPAVRRAALASVVLCAVSVLLVAVPVTLWPGFVAGLYLEGADPANAGVLVLVETFLPIASAFMLFDAIQVSTNQSLRGLKDVRIPMYIVGVCCWLIGFSLAYGLGLHSGLGALGVWWGLLAALVSLSVLLSMRLYWLVQPGR